jgi:nitrate reductase NapE component
VEESAYPPSIEKMSEKWRSIQQQSSDQPKRRFAERNYLALGIGIGLLIIAFLIVIGGFAFLVWNAR